VFAVFGSFWVLVYMVCVCLCGLCVSGVRDSVLFVLCVCGVFESGVRVIVLCVWFLCVFVGQFRACLV